MSRAPCPLLQLDSTKMLPLQNQELIPTSNTIIGGTTAKFKDSWTYPSVYAALPDHVSSGIHSITFTILSLKHLNYPNSSVSIGVVDSSCPFLKLDEAFGKMNSSGSIVFSSEGYVTSSSNWMRQSSSSYERFKEGDCVRIEVNLSSCPSTVSFFVNGAAGRCFGMNLPSSVIVAVSFFVASSFQMCISDDTSSIRIDQISQLSHPTPLPQGMDSVQWLSNFDP
ncbi:hypothetical protein BLNAU_10296 [Blattamonas nauphoetae]|uniref:B30.2/SPRY domain-containing protein n=1 Tax=Blattamonas nauphoetae TaxID=2049346 RepID=A0ABQ9XTK1_9EUKA|nr:hypothetical protein BLNAU_10296 [Blattamonas nauphoetae]